MQAEGYLRYDPFGYDSGWRQAQILLHHAEIYQVGQCSLEKRGENVNLRLDNIRIRQLDKVVIKGW